MNKTSERVAVTAAALLLQAGFLLLLLQALRVAPLRKEISREFTLILPRLRTPPPAPASGPRAPGIPSMVRPLLIPLSPIPPSAIPLAPPSSIQGFGQALNNCAPENYANLTEDQKALCRRPGEGVAVQEAPPLMGTPSQVKDPARWANALAHEQSPPWIPCSIAVQTPAFDGGGQQGGSGLGFNPLCLVQKFADGSLTDPMRWPTYQVKQLQPEDFYQIEQTYQQWHADHAKQR